MKVAKSLDIEIDNCFRAGAYGCNSFTVETESSLSGEVHFDGPVKLGAGSEVGLNLTMDVEGLPSFPLNYSCPACGTGTCDVVLIVYTLKVPLPPCPLHVSDLDTKFNLLVPAIPKELSDFPSFKFGIHGDILLRDAAKNVVLKMKGAISVTKSTAESELM